MNQIDSLTQINLDDLISSFGLQTQSVAARLLYRVFLKPARDFAGHMVSFDRDIGHLGLPEASRRLQRRYVKDVRVHGAEHLPPGPILVLANHPGMTDTTSLFSALGRADLKVVALPRPFLIAMPNMSSQLLYVMEQAAERMRVVREVSAHLRERGAVLTFPAGRIEPDPGVLPGAVDSLAEWTPSVGLFVRNAPETAILPVVVRNAVWGKAARSPLLKFKHSTRDKEKLAAALQLLAMILLGMRPVTVHVQIGLPIHAEKLETPAAKSIHQAVMAAMRTLIENPPQGEGISALGPKPAPKLKPLTATGSPV